jgi:hypothetical protein
LIYAEVVLALNCGGAEMMLLLLFQPQTKAAVAVEVNGSAVFDCACVHHSPFIHSAGFQRFG